MLMGLPEDFCEQEFIGSMLGPYAKALSWDPDTNNLARLIVRARVVDLESVPHFVLFSETVGV